MSSQCPEIQNGHGWESKLGYIHTYIQFSFVFVFHLFIHFSFLAQSSVFFQICVEIRQIKRIYTFSGFQSVGCHNSRETGIWPNTMMNYNHQLYDDTKTTDRSLDRNRNKGDDNNGESSLESTFHDGNEKYGGHILQVIFSLFCNRMQAHILGLV